nr:protein FLX-like 2 [Ipomoea batatas]
MGSKSKPPPPFLRHPPLGPSTVHPDPYGPSIRPPPGGFPPFEMLSHPEIMEQKLATQHAEMQKLAKENHRLAATHGTLRQELAAAKHELQLLHTHIGAMKSEKEQQTTKARGEAQSLIAERQELILKVQQLGQDLQRTHSNTQQIPLLLSELEALRQEYSHCRATYEYDRKFYHDHIESLKVMEKNYMTMAGEVEKLRAELNNTANLDRTGTAYGNSMGHNESDTATHYPVAQNIYGDGYGVAQGRGPLPPMGNVSGVAAPTGNSPNFGAHPGPTSAKPTHDASKMPNYDAQIGRAGPGYDAQRVANAPGYDAQRGASGHGYTPQSGPTGASYDAQRGPGYDHQRIPGYDTHTGPGYDGYRSLGYDANRGSGYDLASGANYDATMVSGHDTTGKGGVGAQGQLGLSRNPAYGSATPSGHTGTGYDGAARGGNPGRR